MVLVEIALVRRHLRIVLPRLGNEHHHHVGQRATGLHEQLGHYIEGGRVAHSAGDGGQNVADVVTKDLAGEKLFSGRHPVLVASDRIDLSVMTEHTKWLRQLPRRECVR